MQHNDLALENGMDYFSFRPSAKFFLKWLSRLIVTIGSLCGGPLYGQEFSPQLYAPYANEFVIGFDAQYLTPFHSIDEMNKVLPADRSYFASTNIEPTLKYLFGPLTHRSVGGVKETLKIDIDWQGAKTTSRGVVLPYSYRGVWLLSLQFLEQPLKQIPVPMNTSLLLSSNWKQCTDYQHNDESFYWYYWDPLRSSCDHQDGVHYQNVQLQLINQTQETQKTYPEYERMLRLINGKKIMTMTFGFGYFEEPMDASPDADKDIGARQYQSFLRELRTLMPANVQEIPIHKKDYPGTWGEDVVIGHRFLFQIAKRNFDVKVVMNAGVDQMAIFARSYAQEHDGYFGWVGHSRVGSGFDAHRFASMVRENPERYSISKEYQLIYWGGCNSYSYYTEPFFRQKALTNSNDPNGTQSLDIIANGLPSYFSLNSGNAMIHFKALLHWNEPTSYQELLAAMEQLASYFNVYVLAIVLGDEDNKS